MRYETKQNIKDKLFKLLVGGSILYVALTGCNHTPEKGIVVGSVQTRIPERHRPEMVLAVRDGTLTQKPYIGSTTHQLYSPLSLTGNDAGVKPCISYSFVDTTPHCLKHADSTYSVW